MAVLHLACIRNRPWTTLAYCPERPLPAREKEYLRNNGHGMPGHPVHQYYQLQDLLVDVLLSSVTAINNTARREHKELCYEQRSLKNSSLADIIETVEELLSGYTEIHGYEDP
jgi:hypothetical protein